MISQLYIPLNSRRDRKKGARKKTRQSEKQQNRSLGGGKCGQYEQYETHNERAWYADLHTNGE